MSEIESLLVEMGAFIIGRTEGSVLAYAVHPDGFDCSFLVRRLQLNTSEQQVMRTAGDPIFFQLILEKVKACDASKFWQGQLCPRISMQPAQPFMDVPVLSLDGHGLKRKAEVR